MDATANDIPHSAYTARGFPTILFAPAGNKDKPMTYERIGVITMDIGSIV